MPISYESLDRLQSEIRLLTILPTSGNNEDQQIRCTLASVSLVFPPPYTALSYCWGDPPATEDIVVNGARVQAGPNLVAALQQFREKGILRIWADALCISISKISKSAIVSFFE